MRLTAQRILADHLRPGSGRARPVVTFWADRTIDLTGAVLIDFDMSDCEVSTARFAGATLTGDVGFGEATFTGDVGFGGATFNGDGAAAVLGGARFAVRPDLLHLTRHLPAGLRWAPDDGTGWRTVVPVESDNGLASGDGSAVAVGGSVMPQLPPPQPPPSDLAT